MVMARDHEPTILRTPQARHFVIGFEIQKVVAGNFPPLKGAHDAHIADAVRHYSAVVRYPDAPKSVLLTSFRIELQIVASVCLQADRQCRGVAEIIHHQALPHATC